jgi:hypothetical protein
MWRGSWRPRQVSRYDCIIWLFGSRRCACHHMPRGTTARSFRVTGVGGGCRGPAARRARQAAEQVRPDEAQGLAGVAGGARGRRAGAVTPRAGRAELAAAAPATGPAAVLWGGGGSGGWEWRQGGQRRGEGGGESFMCVYWVAVPEAMRARRANRRRRRRPSRARRSSTHRRSRRLPRCCSFCKPSRWRWWPTMARWATNTGEENSVGAISRLREESQHAGGRFPRCCGCCCAAPATLRRDASHRAFMRDEARVIVATLAYGLRGIRITIGTS